MRFVCSRIDESVELSNQFNQMINPETGRFFRTIALNGDATNKTNADQIFDTERTEKIDKADGKMQPLDYIFSIETYPDCEFVQQVVAQIPWGHNIVLMDKIANPEERKWYIEKSAQNGWSRNVLVHQIESGLYQRQVLHFWGISII